MAQVKKVCNVTIDSMGDLGRVLAIFKTACNEAYIKRGKRGFEVWVPKSCKLPKTKPYRWAQRRDLTAIKKMLKKKR